MPGGISTRSTTRLRRIFFLAKRKRRRAGRPRVRKLHRDARQNRVTRISREEKTGSPTRSAAARHLSTALYNGHVHAHPVLRSSKTRARAGLARLFRHCCPRCDIDLGSVQIHRALKVPASFRRRGYKPPGVGVGLMKLPDWPPRCPPPPL